MLYLRVLLLHLLSISAMAKFDKILENEGLVRGVGCFADTPFTCFSMTRDYICGPHDDTIDYGYQIIVWLYPGITSIFNVLET
jgi:hypothetical protein